ncbi:MAG: hypothetical protein LBH43_09540, partial [Treponema sp.]|nr:hypothetical protein [Treponema sp.]
MVYYYAYDADGVRKGPWTTNCLSITEARNFINTLIRTGVLIPDRKKPVPFGEYAKGFWEPDSAYARHQKSRRDVTEKYMDLSRGLVNCQILPFFSAVPLDKITSEGIDKWLLGFKDRGMKDGKTGGIKGHYKNSYANAAYRTFNIMLAEAVRQGLIKSNPCSPVKRLKNNRKEIEILTVEEVRKFLPKDYRSVWGDKEIAYAANLLASITGMRIGEILGLRGEYVFDTEYPMKHKNVYGLRVFLRRISRGEHGQIKHQIPGIINRRRT